VSFVTLLSLAVYGNALLRLWSLVSVGIGVVFAIFRLVRISFRGFGLPALSLRDGFWGLLLGFDVAFLVWCACGCSRAGLPPFQGGLGPRVGGRGLLIMSFRRFLETWLAIGRFFFPSGRRLGRPCCGARVLFVP